MKYLFLLCLFYAICRSSLKSIIDQSQPSPPFHEREIWWCSIGVNVGDEQDGKNEYFERPVLIIKKFNRNIFWGLPLTSRKKEGKYYMPIHTHIGEKNSMVILSQIRIFSAKRLIRKMGKIGKRRFYKIKRELSLLLY